MCLADDDAAAAGHALEATGDVHLAPEDGVVEDVRGGTHEADDDGAGVDAGAEGELAEHRQGRLATFGAQLVLGLTTDVLLRALLVDGVHRALGVNGRTDATDRMARVVHGCTPEGHDAVTDVFVEGAVVLLDLVRDGGEVEVDGVERLAGALVVVEFRRLARELVGADVFLGFDWFLSVSVVKPRTSAKKTVMRRRAPSRLSLSVPSSSLTTSGETTLLNTPFTRRFSRCSKSAWYVTAATWFISSAPTTGVMIGIQTRCRV